MADTRTTCKMQRLIIMSSHNEHRISCSQANSEHPGVKPRPKNKHTCDAIFRKTWWHTRPSPELRHGAKNKIFMFVGPKLADELRPVDANHRWRHRTWGQGSRSFHNQPLKTPIPLNPKPYLRQSLAGPSISRSVELDLMHMDAG